MRWSTLYPTLLELTFGCLTAAEVGVARATCRDWRHVRSMWRRITNFKFVPMSVPNFVHELNFYSQQHIASLAWMAQLTNLRSLNLRGCSYVTDAELVHIANLARLQHLKFLKLACDVAVPCVAHLARVTHLEFQECSGRCNLAHVRSEARAPSCLAPLRLHRQ